MVDRLRDLLGGDDDEQNRLPEHEYNDPNTVGAGVMGAGGTAVDRGTGQIDPSNEDDFGGGVNDDMNRRSEVNADEVDAGDLFGGRSETTGLDDDNDEVVPPQARTL